MDNFYYDTSIDEETSSVEVITPKIAMELLKNNFEKQRKEVVSHTKRIAGYITNKQWVSNGNSIKITKKGMVIDGQHRLRAIVLANMPIKTWVIRNMSETAYLHQDDTQFQRTRKLSDFLCMAGYTDTILLASIVAAFLNICRNAISLGYLKFMNNKSLSNEDALHVLSCHPWITNALGVARRKATKDILSKSLAGALYYAFCTVDKTKAYEFFEMLNSRKDNDYLSLLKERLNEIYDKEIEERVKVLPIVKYNLVVDAFNSYINDRKLRRLDIDGINIIKISGFNLYCRPNEFPPKIEIH